jgi:hypothetical protein
MKSMTRQTLSGPFLTQYLGNGVWSLARGVPVTAQVYLRIEGRGGDALQKADISSLQLEWHARGVTVRIARHGAVGVVEAHTAIIHEARPRLYDVLPLPGFDSKAKRFWRRIFLLMRIPGGRHLLRLIVRARPTRKG